MAEDMTPLYQTIVDRVPAPNVDSEGTLQMQISQLDYNNYVGVIGIGRIKRGKVKPNQQVTIIDSEGKTRNGKVGKVLTHRVLSVSRATSLKRATSSLSPVWVN